MAPLVSVVMPCFNAGRMLRPALASVLQQTYPTIEVIFVDNNSTDDSERIARTMLAASQRPFIVTECSAQGSNHARNHGYTFVRGDYIQWMDADDAMNHDKIERQVAALATDATADIAYGDWSGHRTQPDTPEIAQHFALCQVDDQIERTLAGIWYPPHLYLLRREAADRLCDVQAWWPERYVGTDVEYSAFAALLGLRFLHVAGAHVHYNAWSDTQASNATPYSQRVASLQAIFERLRCFVASANTAAPVTSRHKILLHQNWTPCRLLPDAALIQLPGTHFALQRRDGHRIELRPHEADVARIMLSAEPMAPFHHALMLAAMLPHLADQHVAVIQTIARFRQERFLAIAGRPSESGEPAVRRWR
jgi:hypothetical protein